MTAVQASELKLIAGGSLTGLFSELGPQFEKATGHKLSIHFNSTPNIITRINAGTPFDVAVVPVDVFKDAAAKGRFVPGPTVDIARVGYGVIVRAGAPKPDISTSDAFKKTLLDAHVDRHRAGERGRRLYRQGLRTPRHRRGDEGQDQGAGSSGCDRAGGCQGRAELGIFLTNVLNAPGVELVGPFPADLQQELVFTAAIAADTKAADAAKAFIDYLKTPAATAAIKAGGMTPG